MVLFICWVYERIVRANLVAIMSVIRRIKDEFRLGATRLFLPFILWEGRDFFNIITWIADGAAVYSPVRLVIRF